MKRLELLFLLVLIPLFLSEANGQDKWLKADIEIKRLSPKEFTDLPKAIINDLQKRRCTIPQSYFSKERHNVIQGEFRKKGGKDWAVLCSVARTSSILVYWDGSIAGASKIAQTPDSGFLQTVNPGEIGFSRIINAVDAKYIYDHHSSYGGKKPLKIGHHGINDIFAEKASTVRYLHRGKWLELQGAD